MKLIVNPHKIEIEKTPVNEKEINVTKVQFEFAEEITNDFVKEAYFTTKGNSYKQIIENNECNIPGEVLEEKGQTEIGVVAYLVEEETEIKRYNPSPVFISTLSGSLKDAENTEPITPSEMEQFEQALQVGLNAIGEAIEDASTLDMDAVKTGNVATITITKQDGTTKEVEINDGADGLPGEKGEKGNPGNPGPANTLSIGSVTGGTTASATITGTSPNQILNLVLPKGDKGDKGETGPSGSPGTPGVDGKDGKDGKDGINGTNGVDGVGLQYRWDGTYLGVKREDDDDYDYQNLQGQQGENGQDGFSPIASVSQNGTTTIINITDKNGTTTATIDTTQIYSNVKVPIGMWVNGKTIYRKVINTTIIERNQYINSGENIDNLIDWYAVIHTNNENDELQITNLSNTSTDLVRYIQYEKANQRFYFKQGKNATYPIDIDLIFLFTENTN